MTRRDIVETSDPDLPKARWGAGPWQSEPDRVEWRYGDAPCLLVRGPLGAWCGYVALYPGHPAYGKPYRDVEAAYDVHGGLMYGHHCSGHVCHVARPGEPADHAYWLGFDCGHAGDITPGMAATMRELRREAGWPEERPLYSERGTYRDKAYAMAEVERLARQLYEEPHGSRDRDPERDR
jgi:hypothetical protein